MFNSKFFFPQQLKKAAGSLFFSFVSINHVNDKETACFQILHMFQHDHQFKK